MGSPTAARFFEVAREPPGSLTYPHLLIGQVAYGVYATLSVPFIVDACGSQWNV